jgi:hypothetical protein
MNRRHVLISALPLLGLPLLAAACARGPVPSPEARGGGAVPARPDLPFQPASTTAAALTGAIAFSPQGLEWADGSSVGFAAARPGANGFVVYPLITPVPVAPNPAGMSLTGPSPLGFVLARQSGDELALELHAAAAEPGLFCLALSYTAG